MNMIYIYIYIYNIYPIGSHVSITYNELYYITLYTQNNSKDTFVHIAGNR